jgi:hypothetical protein
MKHKNILDSNLCHKKTGHAINQWAISKLLIRCGQKPDTAGLQQPNRTKSRYIPEFEIYCTIIPGIPSQTMKKQGTRCDQWHTSKFDIFPRRLVNIQGIFVQLRNG